MVAGMLPRVPSCRHQSRWDLPRKCRYRGLVESTDGSATHAAISQCSTLCCVNLRWFHTDFLHDSLCADSRQKPHERRTMNPIVVVVVVDHESNSSSSSSRRHRIATRWTLDRRWGESLCTSFLRWSVRCSQRSTAPILYDSRAVKPVSTDSSLYPVTH